MLGENLGHLIAEMVAAPIVQAPGLRQGRRRKRQRFQEIEVPPIAAHRFELLLGESFHAVVEKVRDDAAALQFRGLRLDARRIALVGRVRRDR